MKIVKQYWLIILVLPLLFSQLSCKKFLDRKPLGAGVNGDVAQGKLEEQIFGLYAATRNWGMTQLPFLMVHSARSDDADKGSTPTDGADAEDFYDNFHYTKDHWLMTAYWDDHYAFIGLANNIIHDIDSAHLSDVPSQINRGEATFMRAWAYFDLVRSFGEVPKIDFKITNAAQANIAKSPVADIYALIDADLQFAAATLPLEWEPKFLGRVTKGSANAMWAKAYLFRGNWTSALAKSEEVINSHKYELLPSYSKVFTESAENGKESIFEIQNYENDNGSQSFSNAFAQYQGVRGSGDWDLGWGWNAPDQVLVDSYEAGDPRKDATILFSGQTDQYGQLVPASPPLARLYWNKKTHGDPARRAATGDRFALWLNMTLIRYADMLLTASESAEELGGAANITKSKGYLEQVRARARGGNSGILPEVTTTDQATLRTAIRKERRAEFGMEYERFFDLVRWGIAQTTFAGMGITFEPRDKYMPLPQSAIDKSGGKLIQNPDY